MVLQEYKDYFTDVYETDDLTVAVCNAEANHAQLSDMPHEQWEDLALYYGVRVPLRVNKTASLQFITASWRRGASAKRS